VNEVGWSILSICVLTAGSLFFSLNNLALRTFSRIRLQEAFKAGDKEDLLDDFIDNAEKFILVCSFFRILANVGIILLLGKLLLAKSWVLVFIIALFIFEVFCLAIPHSWTKYTGEKILSRSHKLLALFAYIAKPALCLFGLHDRLVRRLAGVTDATPDQEQEEKQEEILSLVEQGRMEGVVDEKEMEMIENVLELGETTAEEIMTPRTDIIAVNVNDDLQAIIETIINAGHSRIPVYEENIDTIVGLIYAKDLLSEIGKSPGDFNIREKMRKPYFIPETKPLNEIVDEYEETPPESIKKIDETTIEVDARTYIDDLNNEFELALPENEDYDTVGGFVFSHLGYVPKTGEIFEYENVKFTIAAAEARKIKRIRIQKQQFNQKTDQ